MCLLVHHHHHHHHHAHSHHHHHHHQQQQHHQRVLGRATLNPQRWGCFPFYWLKFLSQVRCGAFWGVAVDRPKSTSPHFLVKWRFGRRGKMQECWQLGKEQLSAPSTPPNVHFEAWAPKNFAQRSKTDLQKEKSTPHMHPKHCIATRRRHVRFLQLPMGPQHNEFLKNILV